MSMFNIKVVDVVSQEDGTALLNLDIDQSTKKYIMKTQGWKRWSTKKFQKLFIEALMRGVKEEEKSNA